VSTVSSRALIELTFQVAMRMPLYGAGRARGSIPVAASACDRG
jgi:hypothetical protein